MADGLTLNGTPVPVLVNTWVEKPSRYSGGRAVMRANNIVSTEDDSTRKRIADCAIDCPDDAAEATLRTLCPKGTGVMIAGDLPVTSFTALVDIGDVTALRSEKDGVQVLLRAAIVHIEQV